MRDKYRTEVPSESGAWQQTEDDIPEMHFPSSDEGAGTEVVGLYPTTHTPIWEKTTVIHQFISVISTSTYFIQITNPSTATLISKVWVKVFLTTPPRPWTLGCRCYSPWRPAVTSTHPSPGIVKLSGTYTYR